MRSEGQSPFRSPRDRPGGETVVGMLFQCLRLAYAIGKSAQDPPDLPFGKIGRLGRFRYSRTLFAMDKNDHLERHLELCRRMYLRMLADGSWPWKDKPDSQESEDMVESEETENDI